MNFNLSIQAKLCHYHYTLLGAVATLFRYLPVKQIKCGCLCKCIHISNFRGKNSPVKKTIYYVTSILILDTHLILRTVNSVTHLLLSPSSSAFSSSPVLNPSCRHVMVWRCGIAWQVTSPGPRSSTRIFTCSMTTPPLVSPFGGQPPPPQLQQQAQAARDVNTASLCRIGQETVQDIVLRTMEIFQLLRNMQVSLSLTLLEFLSNVVTAPLQITICSPSAFHVICLFLPKLQNPYKTLNALIAIAWEK